MERFVTTATKKLLWSPGTWIYDPWQSPYERHVCLWGKTSSLWSTRNLALDFPVSQPASLVDWARLFTIIEGLHHVLTCTQDEGVESYSYNSLCLVYEVQFNTWLPWDSAQKEILIKLWNWGRLLLPKSLTVIDSNATKFQLFITLGDWNRASLILGFVAWLDRALSWFFQQWRAIPSYSPTLADFLKANGSPVVLARQVRELWQPAYRPRYLVAGRNNPAVYFLTPAPGLWFRLSGSLTLAEAADYHRRLCLWYAHSPSRPRGLIQYDQDGLASWRDGSFWERLYWDDHFPWSSPPSPAVWGEVMIHYVDGVQYPARYGLPQALQLAWLRYGQRFRKPRRGDLYVRSMRQTEIFWPNPPVRLGPRRVELEYPGPWVWSLYDTLPRPYGRLGEVVESHLFQALRWLH